MCPDDRTADLLKVLSPTQKIYIPGMVAEAEYCRLFLSSFAGKFFADQLSVSRPCLSSKPVVN